MNSISVAQLTVSRSTTNNDEALPRLRIPLAELAEHRQRKSGRKRSDKAAEAETPAAAAAVGALMRLDAPRSPAGPRSIVRISSSPSLSPGNSVDTDLGDPAQGSAPSDEPTKKQSRLTPSRVNGCWQLRAAPLRDPFHLPQKTPLAVSQTSVRLLAGPELHSPGVINFFSVRARASICHLPLPSILSDPASFSKPPGTPPGSNPNDVRASLPGPPFEPGISMEPTRTQFLSCPVPLLFPPHLLVLLLQLFIYRPQCIHRHPSIASPPPTPRPK
ncbi:hypothetical protein FSOLCH5_010016 [Fusarium solani]